VEVLGLRRLIWGVTALAAATLAVAGVAGAGPAVSTTAPFTYDGVNPCTEPAEAFTGTGTLHFLLSENVSNSGALQHHLQTTIDGLKAVTPTGKTYVVHDIFSDEFVFSGTTAEETFDITAHYVRLGEDGTLVFGDDFYSYLRTHITANATGTPSFHVNASQMPCQ
jgi:hypothetical protein